MKELKVRVDDTEVTFRIDDNASQTFEQRVRKDGRTWLKEARNRLTRAINYSAKAMVEPAKVAAMYWDLLYIYFGIPRLKTGGMHQNRDDINIIIKKIEQASIGLNADFVIADLSQMPGLAAAQLKCMNAINSVFGKKEISLAGFVFVDVVEASTRYLKSFWTSTPSGVTMNPYAGPIHLNFEELWKGSPQSGVVTLIHEATHKFAQTTDEQYFPEESAWDKLDNAIDSLGTLNKNINKYDTFEDLLTDARKIALGGKMGDATRNLEKMDRTKALNNATFMRWRNSKPMKSSKSV